MVLQYIATKKNYLSFVSKKCIHFLFNDDTFLCTEIFILSAPCSTFFIDLRLACFYILLMKNGIVRGDELLTIGR